MEELKTIEHICYTILLAIGESNDLTRMLSTSLSAYMRELNCSRGAVLLRSEGPAGPSDLSLVYSIPRKLDRHESFNLLYEEIMHSRYITGDELVRQGEDGIYYVLSIGDIGLLVLYRKYGSLPDELIRQLRPVNSKLAVACRSCTKHEAYLASYHRFMDMVNMLPGIIFELDRDLTITFYNRYTQEVFQQVDSSNFSPETLYDFFPADEKPSVRALFDRISSGEELVDEDLWMINSRQERYKVNLLVSPIRSNQAVTGYRGIATDVTHRYKLEQDLLRRDKALQAITFSAQELVKSDDLMASLETVLRLVGEGMAVDRCYLFVNDHDASGRAVTTSQRIEWCAPGVVPEIDNPELQALPMNEGDSLYQPLFSGEIFSAVVGEMEEGEIRELLESQSIRSLILLPIYRKKLFWGFIGFDDCSNDRQWAFLEQGLLEVLAVSISEAIERKDQEMKIRSLYDDILEDLDTAQSIQNYLLPPWSTRKNTIVSSSNYLPSEKIGGDLFDCFQLSENQYIFYVADISGHGVQAALIMTAVKSIIKMILTEEEGKSNLGRVMTKLNAILCQSLLQENYMTILMCYLDLESDTLSYLNAGHPPLLILNREAGTMRALDAGGAIPVGWIGDHVYRDDQVETVPVLPADRFCLYTDGVYECADASGELLGFDRFLSFVSEELIEYAPIMIPHVCFDRIRDMGYHDRGDDFTFIVFHTPFGKEAFPDTWCFHMESDLQYIDQAVEESDRFMEAHQADEVLRMHVRLVMTEFLANIITHGFDEPSAEIIVIEIDYGEEVVLTFRDRAMEWDMPPKAESQEHFFDMLNDEQSDCGRGMQLIYAVSESHSRVRYDRVNETRIILKQS